MKSLNSINISSFEDCTINEFDAPNLNTITVDFDDYNDKNYNFTVGKKNFQDSAGIL